ncbi:MAG: ROK family protein [Acidimicrobiia bacterium]
MGRATKGWPIADNPISDISRRGLASEELRRHNLAAVLDGLHLGGAMSRSDLAIQTGLNRSTIRDLLAELGELGLVVESPGQPSPGPGRPSSMAHVSPSGAVILAVELEVESIAVATIGLGGHIFGEAREPNPAGTTSPEDVVSRLSGLAGPLLAQLPLGNRVVGVGVAVAGVVRRSDGFVHVAPNLGWSDVPIAAMIQDELGIDLVMVANEADMGALGEFRRGAARESRHLIFVAGEVGVGIGIVHESAPMLGATGYAGEAGHTLVNPGGRECRCGSRGCWETEVGEGALIRRAGLVDGVSPGPPLELILRRAEEGDPHTLGALWETGRWLGMGIGSLINIFNPDLVIVGGFYEALYDHVAAAVELGAKEVALDAPWDACSIVKSELAGDSILIGVAELVLGVVISDPTTRIEDLAAPVS